MMQTSEARSETQFGKYSITRRIAGADDSALYLATSDGPGGASKPCVLKRIPVPDSDPRGFRELLGKEAQVAAMLNHPNIVRVYEYGEVDGEYYLAMEYVDGGGLDQALATLRRERMRLDLPAVLALGLALADALAYVHGGVVVNGEPMSVLHRDVCPSNILVSSQGMVKLSDFKIFRPLGPTDPTTATTNRGKYGYMAPEQLMGLDVDGRADIFSLGAVLIELLIGRPVFDRSDVAGTITAVLGAAVPHAHSVRPDLPRGVDDILQRALARRREQRYPTARALYTDLLSLASNLDMSSAVNDLSALARNRVPSRPVSSFVPQSNLGPPTYPSGFQSVIPPVVEPEDEGYALVFWVALVTTAAVAGVVFLILRMGA